MGRPDPIEYAERLYGAIRAANFSPLSFLAFGNAVKDGATMRNMPRIAAEPFMRVVGEMLDFEGEQDIKEAELVGEVPVETLPADPIATGSESQAAPARTPRIHRNDATPTNGPSKNRASKE